MAYAKGVTRTAQPLITSKEMMSILGSDRKLHELVTMHRYRRPARSKTEAEFCKTYLATLRNVTQDDAGNWIGQIGTHPTVMWSSHTDTVHREQGMQKLSVANNYLGVGTQEKRSSCLGADCTVGVWLMRQMYLAGIPGLYVWHAEEEVGGNGSLYIAQHSPALLDGIQAAIAFDRKGRTSVITHQFSQRTASDEFARSMAKFLGGSYAPDSGGTFTDTANYEHLVPECTNISVGYYDAHLSTETLDLLHARDLLTSMLTFDESTLVIARDPQAVQRDNWWDDPAWARGKKGANAYGSYTVQGGKPTTLRELVREHPDVVADLLEDYGISVDDILDEVCLGTYARRRR